MGADHSEHTMTTGFIGLGVMGAAMARNLTIRSPHDVLVFDRDAQATTSVVEVGAVQVNSVVDLVSQSDIVHTCLPGGPQLEEVFAGPGGVLTSTLEGKLFIDHTTAPVDLTRRLAASIEAAGGDYCDAPVARTRQAAVDGTLAIMVGGSADAVRRAQPNLECMGTDISHVGGVGAGQLTKLLNNMVLFQNVRALAEAYSIATGLAGDNNGDESFDFDIDEVFATIAKASGGSFALNNHATRSILPGEFPTNAFSTTYALKDLSYALELAQQAGVDAIGASTTYELMSQAQAKGYGDEYFPVMARLLAPDS